MKRYLISVILLFGSFSGATSQIETAVDTSGYYSFHINYWFNLHHFLWLEAFLNIEADSTMIHENIPFPERQKLDLALEYYKKNLAHEDLRFSDYMSRFRKWMNNLPNQELGFPPEDFLDHVQILKDISPIYKRYFWPDHREACLQVLQDNLPLILATEKDFVDRITTLTRQFWQEEKIRVDITFVAKITAWNLRNRPYTSLFPTHVVMNAIGENEVRGNWLELLYHESAHHLILTNSYFVSGTINDLVETEGLQAPRELWHAYLFFFTGQVTKRLLLKQGVDYTLTYMERNNVFSRYHPLLLKHLMPYLDREVTLAEATRRFIQEYNKS